MKNNLKKQTVAQTPAVEVCGLFGHHVYGVITAGRDCVGASTSIEIDAAGPLPGKVNQREPQSSRSGSELLRFRSSLRG